MNFKNAPVILAPQVFEAAKVSRTRGNRVLEELRRNGVVATPPTPTGRNPLTPEEGQRLFEALTAK